MKNWFKRQWLRFKGWAIALLIAIGLMSVPALAGTLSLSWTNADQRTDGTVFDPATEQAEIRIYCNGDTAPTFVSVGVAESLDSIVTPGDYACYATTVDTFGQESDPSGTVFKVVLPARPNPPVLN